jgi:hypothetical protein
MNEITIERIYIASVEQSNAINAANDNECTRDVMAGFYRDCIIADKIHPENGRVDFKAVNQAILQRWPKGLNYIKEKAWKLGEEIREFAEAIKACQA